MSGPLRELTDLGTLPNGDDLSYANAINNHGQIVGYSTKLGVAEYHAVLWTLRSG